jgi:hypothetical protein
MAKLFEGWSRNYGVYKLTGEVTERGKQVGHATSIAGEVTLELWSDHLKGKIGLGIIPLNMNGHVRFAAIDVDDYNIDLIKLAKKIEDEEMPLVLCRTKSGGAHLYMFMTDWTPSKLAIQKLREMSAYLGFGDVEIFPKQVKILIERGDSGSWINMPYQDCENTLRYAISSSGQLSITKFIALAVSRMVSPDELAVYKTTEEEDPLYEAPPCLCHLARVKFHQGTRNDGLLNLGVYAKMSRPDDWEGYMHELNKKFMEPPLSDKEVDGVIKTLRKDYHYTCKREPIRSHCDRNKCRTRKYGIGLIGAGMPRHGTLSKVLTDPPIWFVDIEGGNRIELTTEELLNMRGFQKRCVESLSIMPVLVKQDLWHELVNKLLEDVTLIEVPQDSTPQGTLRLYLEDFCTSRVQGKTHDELLLGKPWTNNSRTYFRMIDFIKFLERQRFNDLGKNRIAVYLKDWGAEKHFFNIRGKGCNCYSIPEFKKMEGNFPVPEQVNRDGVL